MNVESPRAVLLKYAVTYAVGHSCLTALAMHALHTGEASNLAFWLNAWFGPTAAIACYAEAKEAWNGTDMGETMVFPLAGVYSALAALLLVSVIIY